MNVRGITITVLFVTIIVTFGPAADPSWAAGSGRDPWIDVPPEAMGDHGERLLVPRAGRALAVDWPALDLLLSGAPSDAEPGADDRAVVIDLPRPDGGFSSFRVVESPVMEPALVARYPMIKTYRGQGHDDPAATVRFDRTPHGFHAMVLSPSGSWFIDPYRMNDRVHHISYFKRDLANIHSRSFVCSVSGEEVPVPGGAPPAAEATRSGEILRTYRIAVASTGEYTIFHGGTVAHGMAAIVTAMNRVNGIYEREVAIRMVLVANNDLIVYTDPASDPYTNSSGSAMLAQNQINLDSVIGSANYDIGHVFSTGGGGVAFLGVVCRDFYKARGVTGLPQPTGDPFYVDYVAHEMGHQWDGSHTFNGNEGSCAGGNRNPSTAYEPGSGSTIMAYAGICGSQDLQPHSDDYFQGVSFSEIVAYSTTDQGATCSVETPAGNLPPEVEAGPGAIIPMFTPFALCGWAVDHNGDRLTYSWEEFDLGPAGHPDGPVGEAPIFRSFNPADSAQRVFPRQEDLIQNSHTLGELLPGYERGLEFRFTARDNHSGGGGVAFDTTSLVVSGVAGPFRVTSPNTDVTWPGGTVQAVNWAVGNTDIPPVSCAMVDIALSVDGGWNFPMVLSADTPNDGSQAVILPDIETDRARIRVSCHGNIFFDISDRDFSLSGNGAYLMAEGFDRCGGGWGGWDEVVD